MIPLPSSKPDSGNTFVSYPLHGARNAGDGSVVITPLGAAPVSEPANLALLGIGPLGLGLVHRRRKRS